MGKSHKKDKKHGKKMTGRQREQKRKIMKLAKLFKNKDKDESSSSSSSSSSSDVDPRQNSQIRRNIRRRALRMAAEALNEQYGLGLNSASSSDTWANKAATLAKALGTVMVATPPTAKAKAMTLPPTAPPPHVTEGNPPAAEPTPQVFPFPPMPPMLPTQFVTPAMFPPPSLHPPPVAVAPQAEGLTAKPAPVTPPKALAEVKAPPKHSSSALQVAELFDGWNLDTRKCNQCNLYTYYRSGICLNKQCPLNRFTSRSISHIVVV